MITCTNFHCLESSKVDQDAFTVDHALSLTVNHRLTRPTVLTPYDRRWSFTVDLGYLLQAYNGSLFQKLYLGSLRAILVCEERERNVLS